MENPNYKPADRIASFGAYYFTSLSDTIRLLKQRGIDVIRLDIGSPDLPPTREIVDILYQSALKPDTHGYSLHAGTARFRSAVAYYYQQRFQVALDPNSEITALIGSKEGLFNLCQAFINPGDLVLVPDPGYPVYEAATKIAGGLLYSVPLLEELNYLVDFDAIPLEIADQAKMMWLNYPNNPTGAIAPLSFLEKSVNFALQHNILIAFDAPYVDVCFDGYRAPSILQIPNAKRCCIEFNSLSKTYNMAGWRLGYACGNAEVINFLKTYKSQVDSANFLPTLDAGTFALEGDQDWLEERNFIYQQRRDLIIPKLQQCGIQADSPKSALYIWCKIPVKFATSEEFTSACLNEIGVSFAPGNIYGQYGEGYFRISMVIPHARIAEAMDRLGQWLC